MPCISPLETEYSLEFVSANPPFLSVLPIPSFKQLLFGGNYSKNPKNLNAYVLGNLFSICKSQDRVNIRQ